MPVTRRRWLALAAASAAPALASAPRPNALSRAERRAGFQLLFDGTSSRGWLEITGKPFPSHCWSIDDGCLHTLVRNDGFQDLRTAASFSSFDLRFDWKAAPGANSGVKYLIHKIDEWVNKDGRQARARGLEYQLCDDSVPPGSQDPRRSAGSLYSLLAPAPHSSPAPGVFHSSRIVLRGSHAQHWLDGVKLLDFDTASPPVAPAVQGAMIPGPISLQNHHSEVWFRSLRILPLPA